MSSRIEDKYKRIYQDIHFERSELFKVISQNFQIKNILYPGSNIHITPSFHFQHVVYVDIADNALSFFADKEQVIELIQKNKIYKQPSYIQFINQDFTKPLSVKENGFDLIIALFASGITSSCIRYLKKGGLLLTNNHHNDAIDAIENNKLIPTSLILKSKRRYTILKANEESFLDSIKKSTNNLLNNNPRGGLQYQENETFYLFQKTKD